MKFNTLGDRIAIEALPGAGKIGLIHIPDSQKDSRSQTFHLAKVLAAGPKVTLARPGRRIYVSEYFGDEVLIAGKKVRTGRERDIIGVVGDCLPAGTTGMGESNLKPVGDRVLVDAHQAEEIRDGIVIPENTKRPVLVVKVVATGDGLVKDDGTVIPVEVKPGDLVYVSKYGNSVVHWGTQKLMIVRAADILGISFLGIPVAL
jgi:chaperonin GroES